MADDVLVLKVRVRSAPSKSSEAAARQNCTSGCTSYLQSTYRALPYLVANYNTPCVLLWIEHS